MNFEYTGRHIEVTPALRSHVESHFEKLTHLFEGNGDNNAHVIIEVERGKHRSEIVVKWHDQVLTATTSVSDMYQSLSQTIDKIEKQALKLKNKIKDKHQKARKVSTIMPPADDVAPVENTPGIVESTNYPVKPMTAEEAVMRLKSEENQFLVFRNSEDERISVIYKRKDGNYGLIEP
ncbi:MAG TPA: ribosome-associated translation inhibitor RaiA [Pyrinomonadaceae bacterium]|nr:ribosome-associated translation inhibitor RaiA [Pyrinomonadaceae bacterium]